MRQRTPTAVPGVLAGHFTHDGRTGVTALLFPAGARAGVHVPGSATGTREFGVLQMGHVARAIHGLCLAGGSAFGLAAADGVVRVLAERQIGFRTTEAWVPIVPAAILYDLHTASVRPDAAMGEAAARAAGTEPLPEGRVGAGAGARVGLASGAPEPGGVGCWAEVHGAHVVAAVVAVNALGSVRDPDTGAWLAGGPPVGASGPFGEQTTLAAVVTDAPLDRERATVIARMASAGFARTLYPAFTPFDGDVVFAASTGEGAPVSDPELAALGDRAARCVATAIARSVRPAVAG